MSYQQRLAYRGEPEEDEVYVELAPGKRTLTEGLIRRKARAAPRALAPGDAFAQATRGPATAVPYRAEMERAFGECFGGVLAHVGAAAADGLDALGAIAAARGDVIAFRDEQPSREVVAHELTHVVQSRRGEGGPGAREVSDEHDPSEREADALAPIAAAGGAVQVGAAASAGIHRHAAAGVARPPAGALQGAAIAQGAKLRDVHASIGLPAGAVLGDPDLRLAAIVELVATMSPVELVIAPRGALRADGVALHAVSFGFATQAIEVDVDGDGGDRLRDALTAIVGAAIAGTPMASPGYDPLLDPTPLATVRAVLTALKAATAPRDRAPDPIAAVADVVLTRGVAVEADRESPALRIAAGHRVTLAPAPDAVALTTDAITVWSDGVPVARLGRVRLLRGGAATLDPDAIEVLGLEDHGDAAAFGRGLADAFADAGPDPDHAATRAALLAPLAAALRRLILDQRDAIAGVDLADRLGLADLL